MLAITNYRALLDRFFVLARMEKLATTKLHMATDMRGDADLLASLHEELGLIHQQKLQLVSVLQEFMLESSAPPLFAAQGQLQGPQYKR